MSDERITHEIGPRLEGILTSVFESLVGRLHHLEKQLSRVELALARLEQGQEKIMADLQTEFTAFNEALARQLDEINTQIQQVADAIAAGQDAAAVVEDARGRITAATAAIAASADALAADNPAPPTP